MTDVVVAHSLVREFAAGGEVVRAVDGVDLTVAAGELLMLIGRSGAGKTTLLSLIGGLDRPDRGTVTVAGAAVESLGARARDRFLQRSVGWVFQTSGLVPMLTAAENIELSLQLAGVATPDIRDRTRAALASVGLQHRSGHTAAQLSGGEQQRVALARALAKAPLLVIADEPTAQLDTETATEIIELLRGAAASGTAVLMATHDHLAAELADRFLTMEDGRVAPGMVTTRSTR